MAKDLPTPTPESSPEASGSTDSPNPEPVNLAHADTPPPLMEQPAPAPGDAPAQDSGDPKTDLAALSQNGNTNRLSPADEDKATRLMHTCLLEGGDGISAALAAMPLLPWILGVRAIENAWKDLPAEARATVLDGLAKMDTDNGYRLRLSMARSLARVELGEAVKVAAATCRSMWNAETGTLKAEHSKLIGNVFIGRGKPWALQLQLADLPPEDANAILSAIVFSTFNVNNAPITQLSVLRYAGSRIGSLHENLIGMVARAVGRWNGKWQSALKKEVTDLPEAILSVLKADSVPEPRQRASEEPRETAAQEAEVPLPEELQEKLRLAAESEDPAAVEAVNQEIAAWREAEKIARLEALDAEDEDEDEDDDDDEEAEPAAEEGGGRRRRGKNDRNDRKDRPAYVSRDQERGDRGQSGFNFSATLKQLESYVTGLRSDLTTAQNRLRRAEGEGAKSRREDKPVLSHEEANLSPDELKRLVIQLEGRVEELKARVEELTSDSEVRAFAMAAGTTEAAPDAVTQLRTLLALKLQEDYADFLTLQKESPDAIVQQHYRGLINHVFEVLLGEQIPLSVPPEPVLAPPLPPSVQH
ncbi:MAG: hypothetical protein ABIP20_10575 [Chthoniobacteraceae bacterium]